MIGDKPSVVARDAQQAAAVAQQVVDNAAKASQAFAALPPSDTKKRLLQVLGGVAGAGGIVVTALTAGTVPAFVVGGVSLVVYLAGLFHPTPQAQAAFGASAK